MQTRNQKPCKSKYHNVTILWNQCEPIPLHTLRLCRHRKTNKFLKNLKIKRKLKNNARISLPA